MKATAFNPELNRPFDPRHVPVRIPTSGIDDAPFFCLKINQQWFGHISGILDRLAYRDAWRGTDAEIQAAIDKINAIIARIGLSEDCSLNCNDFTFTIDGSGDLYIDCGDGPELIGHVVGPQGIQGDQGIQGETGAQGIQGPQGTQGIQGIQGIQGTAGLDGKTILSGSGSPSSGLGTNGDYYIDYTNWNIYGPKTSGSWGASHSIIGPVGATGSQGPIGLTGPIGPTGANGTNGTSVVVAPTPAPPITGTTRCAVATAMTEELYNVFTGALRITSEQRTNFSTGALGAGALMALIFPAAAAYIGAVSTFTTLYNTLLTAEANGYIPYFNSTVKTDLKNKLYCRLPSTGIPTQTILDNWKADIISNSDPLYQIIGTVLGNTPLDDMKWAASSAPLLAAPDCSGISGCGWIHTFDFTLSNGGFVILVDNGSNAGLYVSSSGWTEQNLFNGTRYVTELDISLTFASRTVNDAIFHYDLTKGAIDTGGANNFIQLLNGASQTAIALVASNLDADGSNKSIALASGSYTATKVRLGLRTRFNSTNSTNYGSGRVFSLTMAGQGTDPF